MDRRILFLLLTILAIVFVAWIRQTAHIVQPPQVSRDPDETTGWQGYGFRSFVESESGWLGP